MTADGSSRPNIWLVRHGETEWSRSMRHTGSTDLPLTEEGRREAERSREKVARLAPDRVIVSPLARARETARLIGLEEAAVVDPRVAERDYGEYEGVTTAGIRETIPGWDAWTGRMPGGESLAAFEARVDTVLDDVLASGAGTTLIVSHAHWIRVFTVRWLGLPAATAALFRLDTAGVSCLGWERENRVLRGWNL